MGEKQLFGLTIAIVVLVLLVVGVFTFLGYRRFSRLVTERNGLNAKIAAHRTTAKKKPDLESKMEGMKSRFENVKRYLPDEKEVEKLLHAFSDKCIEAKLEVVKIEKAKAKGGRRRRGAGAAKIQVEKLQFKGKFRGTFHSLAKFVSMVEDWEHFKRFVSITEFKAKAAGGGMAFDSGSQLHEMNMVFELYMYQPPKAKAAPSKRSKRSTG